MTISTPSASATVAIVSEKVRQRRFGSVPSRRTRSRSALGTRTAITLFSGHSIRRVCPSSIVIVGRVDWKSKKSSGSIRAISSPSRSLATEARAVEAAAAAAFQPRKAQTRTGERRCGRSPSQVSEFALLSVDHEPRSLSGSGAGAADELGGHEEGERGEAELQGAFGDVVGGGDADEDAERREGADDQRLAQADVAVAALAVGADDGDDDDHQQRGRPPLDLAEADEDGQRRDEENAAADSDEAAGHPAGEADQRRGELAHEHFLINASSSTCLSRQSSREDQLHGDRDQEQGEEVGDGALGDALLDRGAEDDAERGGNREQHRGGDVDVAVEASLGEGAEEADDDDRGEAGAGGEPLPVGEPEDQQRHDDRPAADPEEAAEEAGESADCRQLEEGVVRALAGGHPAILSGVSPDSETAAARGGDWSAALAPLRAEPGRTAILTDVDGTLAPIVERASEAAVPTAAREALAAL